MLLAGLAAWVLVDTSEELTQEQSLTVRQFVLRTQSLPVREHFNQVIEDGRLTVNETKAVIEAAKKAEPGYGLVSDQNNNK